MSFRLRRILLPSFLLVIFSLPLLTFDLREVKASSVIWQKVSQEGPAETIKPQESKTQISATVGGKTITISGYTSPYATVFLSSSQGNLTPQSTKADKNGYFLFRGIFIPLNTGELWLQTQDEQKNTSIPLAIPEPAPETTKIEDLILPPTLAQTKGIFIKKTNAFAFGYGLPESEIEINLFKAPSGFLIFKPVFAQAPITLKVTTDARGHFSFNLPNQTIACYKIFAGNIYQNNHSQKSPTLSFRVISWWQYLLLVAYQFIKNCLIFFKESISNLSFLILLETIILLLLLKKTKKDKQKAVS